MSKLPYEIAIQAKDSYDNHTDQRALNNRPIEVFFLHCISPINVYWHRLGAGMLAELSDL